MNASPSLRFADQVSPLEKLSDTPCRTLELWASPAVQQAARLLAAQRTSLHDPVRKTSECLGKDRNLEADRRGLLAEMVVVFACERWGLAPSGYQFVAERPVSGADFRIGARSYDVKTTLEGSRYLSCNERQRLSRAHQNVDFLLPCLFVADDCLAVFAPIPYAEVSSWPLRAGREGRQDYRSLSISAFKPITCLRQIVEVTA